MEDISAMRYRTVEEMRALDSCSITTYGIPGIVLMENAALRAYDSIVEIYGPPEKRKYTIICGNGNNGGDGFALARHLFNNNAFVVILYTGIIQNDNNLGEAQINASIAKKMNIPIYNQILEDLDTVLYHITTSDVVVDAVFGIGLSRTVKEPFCRLLQNISKGKIVVSLDVPSGLDSDSGEPLGVAVHAHTTITFGCAKQGFRNKTSQEYTGTVRVVDISIPRNILYE